MVPEIVQGPNLKKVIHPFPLGSKNISLDSFSNTLNYNHTIHFQAKLGEFYNFNARNTWVLHQSFGPYHGRGMPPPTPSPLDGVNINCPPPNLCIYTAIVHIGS